MKNIFVILISVIFLSSCSHVVTMQAVGSSIDEDDNLTLYFKHKDKISYAIVEPYEMTITENGELGAEPYNDDMTLIVTSADKKSIKSVALKNGNKVTPKSVKSMYRIDLDDDDHPIDLDTLIQVHRKWHLMEKVISLNNLTEVNRLHLYNVRDNQTVPMLTQMSFRQAQHDYIVNYTSNLQGKYFDFATTATSQYTTLGKRIYHNANTYYYSHSGSDFYLVRSISTNHFHHYTASTLDQSSIRSIFATSR